MISNVPKQPHRYIVITKYQSRVSMPDSSATVQWCVGILKWDGLLHNLGYSLPNMVVDQDKIANASPSRVR